MEDYDVTTLPEEYVPIKPQSTGGFRVFVILCCVALLCLGGYELYNWLETGNMGEKTEAVIGMPPEARPPTVPRNGIPKLEHEVKPVIYTKFDVRTKDGVLITVETRSLGKLSISARDALRNLIADTLYDQMHGIRPDLKAWADHFGVGTMTLKSKMPLTQPPKSKGGEIKEDAVK